MSLANVEIGDLAPDVMNCIIEIPKGSSNKYEIDMESGVVRLDRVLYSPLFYPYDYGFIPQTIYTDGDPLDLLVLISHPTFPGCVVEVRPIGILGMRDEKGRDDKVLAVATRDPRFSGIMSLEDLGEHTRKEIVHFFEVYKELEDKTVEVLGWEGAETAKELISRFRI